MSGEYAFVIQEHFARSHHFDFRLEKDGVLKSWAVPKGVPQEPGIKRLAVQVEDHALEYGDFEGEIPEGQYGAGTVSIWDKGTFAASERGQGKITVRLSGGKLNGLYRLVRFRGKTGNNWLISKLADPETA
jgi:bifunctional non-homologous end joining protein LigD